MKVAAGTAAITARITRIDEPFSTGKTDTDYHAMGSNRALPSTRPRGDAIVFALLLFKNPA
ncbi:MAG: hypothetical protein P9F19_03440 [Candidatus Contendobacter sp.]|nr:hypothetical protein [Candidatus Contendobacter sp.]MDG4556440.1 hypothetical protein [Candidatus Contendobacter sp.]